MTDSRFIANIRPGDITPAHPTDTADVRAAQDAARVVGIPYAHVNPDGSRTCPVCGESIAELFDATGETTSNNYGAHYALRHAR